MKIKEENFSESVLVDVTILKPVGYYNWSHKERSRYDAKELVLKRRVQNIGNRLIIEIERTIADLVSDISPR